MSYVWCVTAWELICERPILSGDCFLKYGNFHVEPIDVTATSSSLSSSHRHRLLSIAGDTVRQFVHIVVSKSFKFNRSSIKPTLRDVSSMRIDWSRNRIITSWNSFINFYDPGDAILVFKFRWYWMCDEMTLTLFPKYRAHADVLHTTLESTFCTHCCFPIPCFVCVVFYIYTHISRINSLRSQSSPPSPHHTCWLSIIFC